MTYLPVLILLLIGLVVGIVASGLSYLIGPKTYNPRKDSPFECGMPVVGTARSRVSVRFYLIAILFLLFDIEAVFFYPWAIVFKEFLAVNTFILVEMALFVGVLLVGFFYVLKKGALEWD